MAIDINKLYDQKLKMYGQTARGTRFVEDFICAVNEVLDDIEVRTGTSETRITSTNTSLSLDRKFTTVISDGLSYKLNQMGEYSVSDSNDLFALYRNGLNSMHSRLNIANSVMSKLGDLGYS